MHHSLKYAIAGAVGVAGLEYVYTTQWYQTSQFNQPGGGGGIIFDMVVGGAIAALGGLAFGAVKKAA